MAKPHLSEVWAKIVEKCWKYESYKKQVLANPAKALKENGYEPSSYIQYVIIEEKDSTLKSYLSLPKQRNPKELAEEDLGRISGGAAGGSAG